MQRRHFLAAMAAVGASSALPALTRAQSGPVRIVVGAPPGGGTDTLARTLAAQLTQTVGGTYVVENRPGAGGNIAAAYVASAAPDGNTLLMCYTSHAINATLYPQLSFDPVADFTPLCHVANAPSMLCARPEFPADNVGQLIELARKSPGSLNIALPGIGSAGHLGAEVLKSMAEIDMVTVPYKGTAQALNDVLAGQVQLTFAGLALAAGQLSAGKLKALGVSSAQPLAAYPNVPPIDKTLPGYDFSAWYGLLGPAGMDPARVAVLSNGTQKALADEKVRERMLGEGLLATGSTPEQFREILIGDIERWGKIVKSSGATAG